MPDSNILISALVFGGRPLDVLEMALSGELTLTVSPAIVDEVLGVLRDKFRHSPEQLAEHAAYIAGCTNRIEPTIVLDVVPDDPDDNRILECAVAASADYVVTGDGDLLRLESYEGIEIMTAAALLARLAQERTNSSKD